MTNDITQEEMDMFAEGNKKQRAELRITSFTLANAKIQARRAGCTFSDYVEALLSYANGGMVGALKKHSDRTYELIEQPHTISFAKLIVDLPPDLQTDEYAEVMEQIYESEQELFAVVPVEGFSLALGPSGVQDTYYSDFYCTTKTRMHRPSESEEG